METTFTSPLPSATKDTHSTAVPSHTSCMNVDTSSGRSDSSTSSAGDSASPNSTRSLLNDEQANTTSTRLMDQQNLVTGLEDPIHQLALVDHSHPLEKRDMRAGIPRSVRGIFPDSTAFTPQSEDRFLFQQRQKQQGQLEHHLHHPSPSQYDMATSQQGCLGTHANHSLDPNLISRPFGVNPTLIRRESSPCLQSASTTTASSRSSSTSHYPHFGRNNYYRDLSIPLHRKNSMDYVNKRLDLVNVRSSRLAPSYSNPDLATARRLASLDGGATSSSTKEICAAAVPHSQMQPAGFVSTASMGVHSFLPYTPSIPSPYYQTATGSSNATTILATTTQNMASNSQAISSGNNLAPHLNPLLVSHMVRHIPAPPPASVVSASVRKQPSLSSMSATTASSQRRHNDQDRYATVKFEDIVDSIYSLCKDQHGCRYLQRRLEDKKDDQRDIIFEHVFPHFVELMTDPFGNYLCQKMMECCTEEQRTLITERVSKQMVDISLNMHGTRAIQKMVEFTSSPEQIGHIVKALAPNVVTLIKDLNGNHVIQRCLQRLSAESKQFIYNAVSKNCVEVATHRHGCCVLQRCIDYSAENQKTQLVNEIIHNALTLVQDPFGNYVVQYVLDLGEADFSDRIIRRFIGHVGSLSVQKFSSNVMEKCIRVAEAETRHHLIEEMTNKTRLESLLRDSYANYVVQTALDFADFAQRAKLVECIRPLLPGIRNTPYGKRIHSKINREPRAGESSPVHQHQHHYHHDLQTPLMGYLPNDLPFFPSPLQSTTSFGIEGPFPVVHNR
ncbi:armadillo-type protein [Dichotomocladium elegans]|nr:armadillo-type protein [Dichotomocladium elegans]